MGLESRFSSAFEAASLLRWWQDAGVDTPIDEVPRQWLAKAVAAPSAKSVAVAPAPVALALPADLEAFRTWLMTSNEVPLGTPIARRVAPTGPLNAPLMVIADVPEAGDVEHGRLLSGEVGALVDRMLTAIGRTRADTYLAAVAPVRPANGRLDDAAVDAASASVQRHVALVAPERLWLMGRAASRAILGIDDLAAAGKLHTVNQGGASVQAIATVHPRILLSEEQAGGERKHRKRTWADMQRLIDGATA